MISTRATSILFLSYDSRLKATYKKYSVAIVTTTAVSSIHRVVLGRIFATIKNAAITPAMIYVR